MKRQIFDIVFNIKYIVTQWPYETIFNNDEEDKEIWEQVDPLLNELKTLLPSLTNDINKCYNYDCNNVRYIETSFVISLCDKIMNIIPE